MKEININCQGSKIISIDNLKEFQGGLKNISKVNLDKLKNSIVKFGFSAPIFIWGNNILDGHQRLKALTSLRDEDGYTIPELPVVEVYATDEKEAKEKLLRIASSYGEFSVASIDEFLKSSDITASSIGDARLATYELIYPPDGIFATQSDGSMEEYKEPQEKLLCCPSCGHKAEPKDFKI